MRIQLGKVPWLLQFGDSPSRVILPQTVGPGPLSHTEVSMRILTRLSVISIAAAVFLSRPVVSAPPKVPSYQQFLSPASPQEVVAARKVDRLAWVDYAEGKRNAYTAVAPQFN